MKNRVQTGLKAVPAEDRFQAAVAAWADELVGVRHGHIRRVTARHLRMYSVRLYSDADEPFCTVCCDQDVVWFHDYVDCMKANMSEVEYDDPYMFEKLEAAIAKTIAALG